MLISITHKSSQADRLITLAQLDAAQVQTTEFAYGKAITFVAQQETNVAEIVLLMEVAAERLLRQDPYTGSGNPLRQFVHPKAYAGGAILAMALGNAFAKVVATADSTAIDLDILLVSVDTALDTTTLHSWLRPLGWQLTIEDQPLDTAHPAWGMAQCRDLRLRGRHSLAEAITHLRVLLCAMDSDHIYWLQEAESHAIIALGATFLAPHPHGAQIQHALSHYPDFQQRFRIGGLMEPDDTAALSPLPAPAFSAEMLSLWHEKIQAALVEGNFESMLWLDAEHPAPVLTIAASAQVTKLSLTHTRVQPLQYIAHQVNHSGLSDAEKLKIKLLQSPPLLKNPLMRAHELVILQGMQHRYPAWHRDAIVAVVCGFVQPKRIIWMEDAQDQFENWASGITKTYPYTVQLTGLNPASAQLQIAIFDLTESI
jgi:RNA repair, ligase-Pnkp-associating, region of Hen1